MEIIDQLDKAALRHDTILTIGVFDGVHRGHQALIGRVVARARATGCLAALITFHPHPAAVLAPQRAPRLLTTVGEKVALLEGLGLDLLVILPFTRQVADTPAREFMADVSRHLRLRELWVGPDFALGHNREGNVDYLRKLGREMGYDLHVVHPVRVDGLDEVVSSSRTRALLEQGQVERVTEMLGRYPSLSGEVVTGARRGHDLGFPTANLEVRAERAVPADGIYAVFALLGERRLPAVANVGVRPTFDNGERIVEVYILDFGEDIYGCDLVIEFVARLRDEVRFEQVADLIDQIERDVEDARAILREAHPPEQGKLAQDEAARAPVAGGSEMRASEPACPYHYEEIEHTADRALRIWGRAVKDLFTGAARGMYHLMADVEGMQAAHWRDVRLEALDRETLLVEWLNELLYLTESEGLLFVAFRVDTLTGTSLVARVGGAPGEVTKAQIKATTFHNIALVRENDGWSTVVTFDV
jgi:riboflavin kinase/FMN adenylyltransferase